MSILIFAAIVAMLPNSVLFPATEDLSVHLHVQVSFIGFMVTTYSVAYVVATPLLGVLSDLIGRKVILGSGLTLFAVGGVFPLATHDATLILIGRAVMGVGSAGILPMVDSLIGDMYEAGPQRRSALAGFAAAIAVADALVPFAGGALDAWHWQAVFAVYALGFVAAACCMSLSLPPVHNQVERTTFTAYARGLQVAWNIRSLVTALCGTVLFGMAYFGLCALLPMALTTHHSGLTSGVLFLPIGVAWVMTSAWLSRKAHLPNVHRYAAGAALALATATLFMGTQHTMAPLLCVGACWGMGSALLTTMYSWIVGDETPPMVRGAMNAVANAGYVLGFSAGAPLFMALEQAFGLAFSTQMIALLLFVTAVVVYRWLRPSDILQPTLTKQPTVQTRNL